MLDESFSKDRIEILVNGRGRNCMPGNDELNKDWGTHSPF